MKCILLLSFVALCYSAPHTKIHKENVHVTEDGSVIITGSHGNQVTITKVHDISGEDALEISVSGTNVPTKTIHISDKSEIKEIFPEFEDIERDKRHSVFVTSTHPGVLEEIMGQQQGPLGAIFHQKIVEAVNSAIQTGHMDESVLELLQNLAHTEEFMGQNQGLQNIIQGQHPVRQDWQSHAVVQDLLQKQATLEHLKQQQLANIMTHTVHPSGIYGVGDVLGQTTEHVPVIQHVLPDGTVITQSQDGFITVGKKWGVTEPSVVTHMGQVGGNWWQLPEATSNILGGQHHTFLTHHLGLGGQEDVPQTVAEIIQKEGEILVKQVQLQQQQHQLQQHQQFLQLQQAQHQQKDVQQHQLFKQHWNQQQLQQQQEFLQQQQHQQQLEHLLNPQSIRGSHWQKLYDIVKQKGLVGEQSQPTDLLAHGTGGIPVQTVV